MVFNPGSQSSCEYYGYEYPYTGKKSERDDYEQTVEDTKRSLVARPSRPDNYTGDYHPNQSRDYALSNTVKCECTSCHVNKNGHCEVPSLINISSGGKCKTGEACMEARRKK
jgi:hypothetical protein